MSGFLTALGSAAVASGIAATVLGFFLNKRLESFKTDQNKTLERVRYRLGLLSSRLSLTHKRELEALDGCWVKLLDAHGALFAVGSDFRSYLPIDRMTDEEVEEFLAASDLLESAKRTIRDARDRSSVWIEIEDRKRRVMATRKNEDFNNFLIYNKPYLGPDLFEKCYSLYRDFHMVVFNLRMAADHFGDVDTRRTTDTLDSAGRRIDEIGDMIRRRLNPDEPGNA
jgi:hypothetical protein